MTVYVDAAVHRLGRMIMCHMVSPDVEELHRMAAAIGVARRWFQDPRTVPSVSRPHYDVAKSKRALALRRGAVEIDRYQMVAISNHAWNIYWAADRDPLWPLRGHREGERVRLWLQEQTGLQFPAQAAQS
jgi:hypothetical protein